MLWMTVDRKLEMPLNRQIYFHIRGKILSGELQAGDKLPSSRTLSTELQVSRNVVLEAYDQLIAEGFLETQTGAGTYVAEGVFLERKSPSYLTGEVHVAPSKNDIINFRSGIPALEDFPNKTWAKLSHALWHGASPTAFGYDVPEGRIELRTILAKYLRKTRGVECLPEQIIITSGATQAMTLVTKLLVSANDEIIIEDPITYDIQVILQTLGSSLYSIPVDEHGMKTSLLPSHIKPKFVFVTPSHQFPLGGTMPIQRRIDLINYARKINCYIVEDDYDSEFRYEGPPVSSLQGLDPNYVIYIGSFSKILSPALRMGYIIQPSELIEKGRQAKWFTDLHTPSIDQLTLAKFIEEHYLERHILKMKKCYKQRRDFFIKCLHVTFGTNVTISGYSTGLHLIAAFQNINFTPEKIENLEIFGVKVYPVEDHTIHKGHYKNYLILGYGHLTTDQIQEGVTRLYKAINKETE
ncbi:PLP-dependent aminotransferase family protein [Bacillus sp. JJ722]|uniref:MocR-like pyridoxine biosynthesis transcription factor PdxR n=1 Tax=Bacillus sp. JJ722 TaxID=3122973 RepID=UPI002FFFAF67